MPIDLLHQERRWFLRRSTRIALAGSALATLAPAAWASTAASRTLAFSHTHTGESIELTYASGARYLPQALEQANHFLRDHYTGEVGAIDPQLLDLLHAVRTALGTDRPFHVISGYRCPATNNRLRTTRGGGVAKRSLHMDGKAIDVRLPGVPLTELRDAALSLKAGGVGTYTRDRFVHLDTGRPRSW
ncbi:MAG: DUF882 domain-containing protein [Burkholderiaceae bacterium]|nr:DUF882 domain-containing protein [Rhodoferax sp.]MCB2004712.1 DUF882 domain-containing protein [Rhodoferax sp.]MCP5259894.1 DUF882 domain-containing protein [Rhodoferax sp.]